MKPALSALPAMGFRLSKGVLLALFVLVDTGQALVMDWAEKREYKGKGTTQYARQTVMVVESILSISTGLMLAMNLGGIEAVQSCLDPHLFLKFLPVACCFALGLSSKMMAVNYFQAGTIKIVGQLRMALTAAVSLPLLGRRYDAVQWQIIALITASCVAFVQQKGQGRRREGKSWKWIGLGQLSGWVLLNVMGGILAEKTYKSGSSPYLVQKVAQDFGHLMVSIVMLILVVPRFNPKEDVLNRDVRPGGFFDNWNHRTIAVVGFLFLDAWIGNLLLKEFSGVTRSAAKSFGVAAVYFISLVYSKERKGNPALNWLAVLVIQSSLLFGFVSNPKP